MIFYVVSKKVMISAGEASGELYGALLSREIKKRWPDTEIFGIGGHHMKEEGVSLIAPITHVVGLVEVIKHLPDVKRALDKARNALTRRKPDVLVLIDYPDFNITLARKAKDEGIPILYYVSPQVWAWRSGRVKKIASLVNRMAVLFPFEVEYYKHTGLPCEFVGHPIAETISITESKEEIKAKLGLDPDRDVISLLPGSRPGELRRHLTIIINVAENIVAEFPDMQIIMPLVPATKIREKLPDNIKVIYGRTTEALACSEAAVVASGTATLETALLGIPMVVYYRVSPLTFFLGKLLIDVNFISLVNLLSGKKVVEELLQKDATVENVFSELKRLLTDRTYRTEMIEALEKIQEMMEGKRTSERVARITGEVAGWDMTGHAVNL
jgi:lipid-A-disaccharide synthase